jgi:hypothetical protein
MQPPLMQLAIPNNGKLLVMKKVVLDAAKKFGV